MSLATLLTVPGDSLGEQETWSFEHAVAHRNLLGDMASATYGLTRFSVLPYLLDPHYPLAGGWLLNHGQAHADFQAVLPGLFRLRPHPIPVPTAAVATLNPTVNYIDSNLSNPEQANWWVSTNHWDHLTAQGVLSATQIFPFW